MPFTVFFTVPIAILFISIFLMAGPAVVFAGIQNKDLGIAGNTYPIAEPDALQEIQEKAKTININKYMNKARLEKRTKEFKPIDLPVLKPASVDRSFTVDLTYTLDFDITDGKGAIVYPRGYTFNPLDYIRYNKTIVVINGNNKKQLEWFENSEYAKDINILLLITNGSYYQVKERLKQQVFYANKLIVERFKLKAVPSVIQQKGPVLEVKEIAIENQ